MFCFLRRSARGLGLTLIVCALVALPASAATVHLADGLALAPGAIHLKGHHLTGRLTVQNRGRARLAAVRVHLTAQTGRHQVTIGSVKVPALAHGATAHLGFSATLPKTISGTPKILACVALKHGASSCGSIVKVTVPPPTTPPPPKPKPTATTTTTTGTSTAPQSTMSGTPSSTTSTPPPATTTTTASPTPTPSCTWAEPTTIPTAPQTPTDPVTVVAGNWGQTPPTAANTIESDQVVYQGDTNAPFFADGLGQYECNANTATSGVGFYTSGYYVNVPPSYDPSTPETLVVQMHGCFGDGQDDLYNDSVNRSTYGPHDDPFIMISLNGPEGGYTGGPPCWTQPNDDQKVLYDIYDAETHFNINRHRIILLGYSSGGDLGYSTIFHHASGFAGILAQNTSPWTQNDLWTGSEQTTAAQASAMAAWKFNILQVGTSGDTTYPVSGTADDDPGVQQVFNDLAADGWGSTHANQGYSKLIVTPGTHGQADFCGPANGDGDCTDASNYNQCTATSYTLCYGTYFDIVNYLLSTVAGDGWSSP